MQIKTSYLEGDALKWAALRACGKWPVKRHDLFDNGALDLYSSHEERPDAEAQLRLLKTSNSNDWVVYGDSPESSPLMSDVAGDSFCLSLADENRISVQIKHDGFRLAGIFNSNDELEHIQLAHDRRTAVLRSFVDSKFGLTVDIPSELVTIAQLQPKDCWIGDPPDRFRAQCMKKYLAAAALTKTGPVYVAWNGRFITRFSSSMEELAGSVPSSELGEVSEFPEGLYLSLSPGVMGVIERSVTDPSEPEREGPKAEMLTVMPPPAMSAPKVVVKVEGGEVQFATSNVAGLSFVVHEGDRLGDLGYSIEMVQDLFDQAASGCCSVPIVSMLESIGPRKADNTFSFRAECPADVGALEDVLRSGRHRYSIQRTRISESDPDVAAQLEGRVTLEHLMQAMLKVPDSHVMIQTLKMVPLKDNDLERDPSRATGFRVPSAAPSFD